MEIGIAIIGGLFTLVGIFLNHHLTLKREILKWELLEKEVIKETSPNSINKVKLHQPKVEKKLKKHNDILIGIGILFLDFILTGTVINIFNLNETDSTGTGELIFAFFVIVVIPIYAIYRIIKGLILRIKQFMKNRNL